MIALPRTAIAFGPLGSPQRGISFRRSDRFTSVRSKDKQMFSIYQNIHRSTNFERYDVFKI